MLREMKSWERLVLNIVFFFFVNRTKLSKEHTVNALIILDILGVTKKAVGRGSRRFGDNLFIIIATLYWTNHSYFNGNNSSQFQSAFNIYSVLAQRVN